MKVAHAYRDGSGVHAGQVFQTSSYDAAGRRISKSVSNTGQWDATFHYYYADERLIETRNGSDQRLKQYVWGREYVDELVQVKASSDPTQSQTTLDQSYWALQDANYNVIGLVDSSGLPVERYEYTPYGRRTVMRGVGSEDPGCYAPSLTSQRLSSGSVIQPYGICEIGHQGLMHDEETDLIYNRARMLHPILGRFIQRDPLGYVDGLSLYQ
jgi:RHS repeat-associated protein